MRFARIVAALATITMIAAPRLVRADDGTPGAPDAPVTQGAPTYLLDHPEAPWWLSGQVNSILQAQPGFHSPYEGAHSFLPGSHLGVTYVATLYSSYQLTSTTAVVFDVEAAGGDALSAALGIAAYTDLDAVRNPSLSKVPYPARVYIDQIIPLSDDRTRSDRNPLHPFAKVPSHRVEIRAGLMSTVDVFDQNSVGTDSHLQFLNWAVDNNAAYDYAADTRGYTPGVIVEYDAPKWAARFGELLMPTTANGETFDFNVVHARGENLELELHGCIARKPGILRLLAYLNHANMGSYAAAIADDIASMNIGEPGTTPDITATRQAGRTKYGFGVNVEQELTTNIHAFARLGWSDGNNESFAYTEADDTVVVGADFRGALWGRADDKVGIAIVSDGLSTLHREYLAFGGLGFLLGDGQLNYGRENAAEVYYTAHAYRGIYPALDVQVIDNPGYNMDRGPVIVGSVRVHVEL